MRKPFIPTLLALMLIIACSEKEPVQVNKDIEFKTYGKAIEQKISPAEDDNTRAVIDISILYATGDSIAASTINEAIISRLLHLPPMPIEQAVDSFVSRYAYDYVSNFYPVYRDNPDSSKFNFYYKIKTSVSAGKNGWTYHATTDYYEGGAHGHIIETTCDFDGSGTLTAAADSLVN